MCSDPGDRMLGPAPGDSTVKVETFRSLVRLGEAASYLSRCCRAASLLPASAPLRGERLVG